MKGKRVNRIAGTLVFWLVVVSSSLTLVGTAVELYFDYHGYLDRMSQRIGQVTEKQIPDIERFIAAGDSEAVRYVLKKLLGAESIAYAAVIVGDEVTWEEGVKEKRYEIVANQPFWVNQQKELSSAVLTVASDMSSVREYIYQKLLHSLIANGIKIFIIAAFVFLMFQFLVTRHLENIARQIKGQDITRSSMPITLERGKSYDGDELDQVVTDLNVMREKAREAVAMLEKNEERLLLFFDSTEEAIVGVTREGVCSFVNDACMDMFGRLDFENVIGQPIQELFTHHELRTGNGTAGPGIIDSSMELSASKQCEDGYLMLPTQKSIPVTLRSYPVYQDGEVSGAIVFMRDNSEKRQLMHERELLSQAVEQSPVMVVIADDQNKIEFVNPGTIRWSGYNKDELIGNFLFSFVTLSPEAEITVKQLEQKLYSGQKWEGVIRTKSKWGTSVALYCVISPVFDATNTIVNTIAICKEVSYEAALHDELLNSKKMEAVGRLSSRFAHEFGNPLFGVRAVIKDLSDRLALSSEDTTLLHLASIECDKMRGLVREFQEVYLETTNDDVFTRVDSVVYGVLRDLELLFRSENICCSAELNENLAHCLVSKNKITLVVRNIILNSIDAMCQHGGELKLSGRCEGPFVYLCICDNGCGIKSDQQELVFEPFFSTKPEVEGAGLGLSVAYGTMKSMGGTITFSSIPGEGACFSIHIPVQQ